jgi:CheY-like chemotaxis protein
MTRPSPGTRSSSSFRGKATNARGATNGFEACECFADGYKPALVLLDMMMGQMDGWDFRRAQQREPRVADIPVVVLTAVVESRS